MAIKGAQALLNELSKPINEIEKDITELKEEKQRLINQLDQSDNQFKMDVVKKNRQIQSDINLTEQTIQKAEKRREQLIKDNAGKTYKQANKMIRDFRKETAKKENHYNRLFIEKIEEVRQAFEEMAEKDKEYTNEIKSFIDNLEPYLDAEEKPELGMISTQKRSLEMNHVYRSGIMTVLDVVREGAFGVKGLMSKPKHYPQAEVEKEKYNVKS